MSAMKMAMRSSTETESRVDSCASLNGRTEACGEMSITLCTAVYTDKDKDKDKSNNKNTK